jgi:hypothetical protein
LANKKNGFLFVAAVLIFLVYVFAAAQPVPPETVLVNVWLRDLEPEPAEEESPSAGAPDGYIVPFTQGSRFGYASSRGNLILNKTKERRVSISEKYWSEYEAAPEELVIRTPLDGGEIRIQPAKGYPFFLDGRIFIIGKDQCSLSELDSGGQILWTYDFETVITSIDAAGGQVLAGTLEGTVELLDSAGKTVFPSYAPAARIPVITGCRISSDGSKIALVAGIDQQRFIFLERYGSNDYRVTYHEFLRGEAFRREVHIAFINNDTKVVFEQAGALGIFDVKTRTCFSLPLTGTGEKIEAMDGSGADGLFFFIVSEEGGGVKRGRMDGRKWLTALKVNGDNTWNTGYTTLLNAPFKSGNVFLARRGGDLFVGGGTTLALFRLDKM